MALAKEKTEEAVAEVASVKKPYADLFSELDAEKEAIASGNIAVLVLIGNPNSPTYREVQANMLAGEIKANFS